MHLARRYCSLFVLFLTALAPIGRAQTATTSLHGVVSDSQGAVIAGVDVVVTQHGTGFTQAHKTNDEGEYNFQQIPPGTYDVKVSFPDSPKSMRK